MRMRRSNGWKSTDVASSSQPRVWSHDRRTCDCPCSEFFYVHFDHCIASRSWRSCICVIILILFLYCVERLVLLLKFWHLAICKYTLSLCSELAVGHLTFCLQFWEYDRRYQWWWAPTLERQSPTPSSRWHSLLTETSFADPSLEPQVC